MNFINSIAKGTDVCHKKYEDVKKNIPIVANVERAIKIVNAYEDLGPGKIISGPLEFQVYQESDRLRNERAMEELRRLENN